MPQGVSLEGILTFSLTITAIFLFPYLLWWVDYKVFGGKVWKFMENPPNDICKLLIVAPAFIWWNIMGLTFIVLIILLFSQICIFLGIPPTP